MGKALLKDPQGSTDRGQSVQGRDARRALEASGTSRSTPAPGPYPQLGSPQCIMCGARSPLLRDLLLSCKLGLFTPNKASDYLPGKRPIDGGGRGGGGQRQRGLEGGVGTVIKPFPAGLSFISSSGRVIFLLETIWGEEGERSSVRKNAHQAPLTAAALCQAKPPPV